MNKRGKTIISVCVCLAAVAGLLILATERAKADEDVLYRSNTSRKEFYKDENEAFGSEDNPFTVLEIVPDVRMAMAGYLIPGCEPIDIEAVNNNVNGLASLYGSLVAGENGAARISSEVFYSFLPPSDEGELASYGGQVTKWTAYSNASGEEHYLELGYYRYVGEGSGQYAPVFPEPETETEPQTEIETETETEPQTEQEGEPENETETENQKETEPENETEPETQKQGETETETEPQTEPENETQTETQPGEEPVPIGFEKQEGGGYDWVPVGYYCKKEAGDEEEVSYSLQGTFPDFSAVEDTEGAYKYVPISTGDEETLYIRCEETFYKKPYFGVTHRDTLIQTAFNRSSFGLDGKGEFKSQVIVWASDHTMDEDAKEVVQKADMIIINAQNFGWKMYNLLHPDDVLKFDHFNGDDGLDLSWDLVMEIMKKMASDEPAAMYLNGADMEFGGTCEWNTNKLYLMLYQYTPSLVYETFLSDTEHFSVVEKKQGSRTYTTGKYVNPLNTYGTEVDWDVNTFVTRYGLGAMHQSNFKGGGYDVAGSVMSFDNSSTLLQTFNDPTAIGIKRQTGNEWWKSYQNEELFELIGDTSGETRISTCVAMDYLLRVAKNNTGYKSELRVLELQPCNQFIYKQDPDWQIYYRQLFPWFNRSLERHLVVDTMAAFQFVGSITDLNSTYDMIILGDKQDATNGLNGYNDSVDYKNGAMGYQDHWSLMGHDAYGNSNGKGMLYTAVGDLVSKMQGGGFNYKTGSGYVMHSWRARYTANDITRKKREELLSYAYAGKPVVVESGLYGTWDSGYPMANSTVDQSSQMYKFLGETFNNYSYNVKNNYENPKSGMSLPIKYARANAGTILKEMTAYEDCSFDLLLTPKPYDYSVDENTGALVEEIYNDQASATGTPQLLFRFRLKGRSEGKYSLKMYVDRNGDGVYAGSLKELEELAAFEAVSLIEEVDGRSINIYELNPDGKGGVVKRRVQNGELQAGKEYEVNRSVPNTERGILPWKLEIYQNNWENADYPYSVRHSAEGYTAIRPSVSEREDIYVLQMDLNKKMENDMKYYGGGGWQQNTAKFSWENPIVYNEATGEWVHGTVKQWDFFTQGARDTADLFKTYLENINDFKVDIDFMMNAEWKKVFGRNGIYWESLDRNLEPEEKRKKCVEHWIEFLDDVDILVLGFRDMATFLDDSEVSSGDIFYEGFMDFVNQGKSVIISHDMVADKYVVDQSGYNKNDTGYNLDVAYGDELRTLAGLRRKYYLEDESSTVAIAGGNSGDYYRENLNYYCYSRAKSSDRTVYFLQQRASDNMYTWETASLVPTNIPVTATDVRDTLDDDYLDKTYWDSGKGYNYTPVAGSDGYYWDYSPEIMDTGAKLCVTSAGKWGALKNRSASNVTYTGLWGIWTSAEGYSWLTDKIKVVNQGQITNYPYNLNRDDLTGKEKDYLMVAPTHVQNNALDLEQCTGGDATVWYSLYEVEPEGFYSSKSMDVASDFYIYTKGNITYTGMGHYKNSALTNDEVKLFVNVMISSYRAALEKPHIEVVNEDVIRKDNVYTLYSPMFEMGGEEDAYYLAELELVDENLTLSATRTYTMQFTDEEGNLLENPPVLYRINPDGTETALAPDAAGNYSVDRTVTYGLHVAQKELQEKGQIRYFMKATAIDADEKVSSKTSELNVYNMPLFNLE